MGEKTTYLSAEIEVEDGGRRRDCSQIEGDVDNTPAGRMAVRLRCQCGGCNLGGRIALEGSGPRLGENGTRTAGSRDEWKWPRAAKIGSFLRFRLLGGVLIDRTTMIAVSDRNNAAAPAQYGVQRVEGVPG